MKRRRKGKRKRGCTIHKPISQKGQEQVQMKNESYAIFTFGNVVELPSNGING